MFDLHSAWNMVFIDSQYQLWKQHPEKVSQDWQIFFTGFDWGCSLQYTPLPANIDDESCLQQAVDALIYRYRSLGHKGACLDPLEQVKGTDQYSAELAKNDFTEENLDVRVRCSHFSPEGQITLRELREALKKTYCAAIGVEYMQIQDTQERLWLEERMESCQNQPRFSREEKISLLNQLLLAGHFENFLQSQYIGQKRFSLEGGEVLIPALEIALLRLSEENAQEVILGMAHRGRLNVLVNILWKLYEEIFCEFDDNYDPSTVVGSSDVRYHKGFYAIRKLQNGKKIKILLSPNPSHLEAVNPVVEGIARARQEQIQDTAGNKIVPILIHGDAAFAGQGIVPETLNLSGLKGYHTGGTIHILVNNQIGFTTTPASFRSTPYSTDIAKMLMVPIFHVNGDDPEAVVYIMQLACDYRCRFHKDVVVDIICYRRYGHNEADEPFFTQPQMYSLIQKRPPVFSLYAEKLKEQGIAKEEEITRATQGIHACMEEGFKAAKAKTHVAPQEFFYAEWQGHYGKYTGEPCKTGVSQDLLLSLAKKINAIPQDLQVHPKVKKLYEKRLSAIEKGEGIDWATAEAMAFATLLSEGHPIRMSGQDTCRGTFNQRHAILYDTKTEKQFLPLQQVTQNPSSFSIYDSSLSELAVLGFEYGYSLVDPNALVLWEAQFGDFVNGAQIILDQFLVSGESKWQRLSALVLLLPHGQEGQGAEHSSARLERFLEMCSQNNIQVANLTTPAQYFHILRRQLHQQGRKPLIVMAPKSLLRHPKAVSSLPELVQGSFQKILVDDSANSSPERVLLCNGKIYYDLLEKKEEQKRHDVVLVRFEQLYPFPEEEWKKIVQKYSQAQRWYWVQEEPENMGAWPFLSRKLPKGLSKAITYIGPAASPTPAVGISKIYFEEAQKILHRSFSEK